MADKLQPSVFFREVAAGFVVSYQEPSLSFCRLSNDNRTWKLSALLNVIYNISAFDIPDGQCREDLIKCANGDFGYCEEAVTSANCIDDEVLNDVTSIPGGYYNSLPYNMQSGLHEYFCGGANYVSKVYPVQDSTTTVTIWYNNQVSYIYLTVNSYIS